jgi:protein O-mannosyl-transferase
MRIERSLPLLSVALTVVGLAAYSGSFGGPFVYDDLGAIVQNDSLASLGTALHPPLDTTAAGRPILNLSLWLNHASGGLEPLGYHVTNLVIHLLAGLLLFGLVRRSLDSERVPQPTREAATGLAFAIAVIWMLHPLQTQSVTYVVQRAESLMGLFFLGTLYCSVRSLEGVHSRRWSIGAIGLGALGMATKEVMVAAPLVVLVLDWTLRPGTLLDKLKANKLLYGGLAATWLLLALLVSGAARTKSTGFDLHISPWEYLSTQAGVLLMYIRLALVPYPQSFDYHDWPIAAGIADALLPGLLIVSLLGLTTWGLVRRNLLGLCGATFFLVLAPTSSVLPIVTEIVAEHRMYLPLAAISTLLVLGVHSQLQARNLTSLGPPLVIALIIGLGLLTYDRNRTYRSTITLWQDVIESRPQNARAHDSLAVALLEANRPEEALHHAELAVQLTSVARHQLNLGSVLNSLSRFAEAEVALRKALEVKDDDPLLYNALGTSLARQDKTEEALAALERAYELDPDTPGIKANLAAVHLLSGRIEDAISLGRKAVLQSPSSIEARKNLGTALSQDDQLEEAIEQFREISALEPDSARHHRKLAEALMQAGLLDQAAVSYRSALALEFEPNDANLLARILATHPDPKVRDGAEAVSIAERMVGESATEDMILLDTLGTAYAETGRFEDAIKAAERALRAPVPEGMDPIVPQIRRRLLLYQSGKPYHL